MIFNCFNPQEKECHTPLVPLAFAGGGVAGSSLGAGLAGAIGAGAGSSVLSLSTIGSVLSFASAASSLFGGFQEAGAISQQAQDQARQINLQADQDILDAREEEIRGKQDSNDILARLNSTMAQQRVAAAANGLDVNYGTPLNVAETIAQRGDIQLSTVRADARARALSRRRQATQRRIGAANSLASGSAASQSAKFQGIMSAAGSFGNSIYRSSARG